MEYKGARFDVPDPDKIESNLRKHGVSFDEAKTVFADSLSITIPDSKHSYGEERWLMIGMSRAGRLLVVCHTERGGMILIVSAREATRPERKAYELG